MDYQVITEIIGSLGFPIFIACWLLIKGSRDNENICKCLSELREAITILTEKVKGHE